MHLSRRALLCGIGVLAVSRASAMSPGVRTIILGGAPAPILSVDWTGASGVGTVTIRDAVRPGNNKAAAAISAFLSNSSASVKWVLGPAGVWSAAPAGIVFEYEPSTGGYYGLLEKLAATNVVLWNRDLSNAAWTKSNVTAAKDQVGIDGVSNSASSLTATAGNGTCLQAVTLASSSRLQSVFIKRIAGAGTVNMTTDNGSTWTAVAVTAAWVRVNIPIQVLANPTIGFRIVTSGDAIAVDMAQNELGAASANNAPSIPTSPIATTTVAVARAADFWTAAANTFPTGAAYTAFIDYSLDVDAFDGYVFELSDNTDNQFLGPRVGIGAINIFDGGGAQAALAVLNSQVAGHHQITVRVQTNAFASSIDGAAIVTDVSGTAPVINQLCFGAHRDAASVPVNTPLKLRRFVMVPTGVADAALPNWRFL